MRERSANDLAVRMFMHGITQQDVADKVGMTRANVGYYLNGKRKRAGVLEKITQAIDEIIASRSA